MKATTTPDEVKSRAYLVWAEWGPNLSIPRAERLATEFPTVPATTRADWLQEFAAIEHAIWGAAEKGADKSMDLGQFAELLRKTFPFMSDQAVRKAWFLANYYAWHEGYR